MSRTFSLACNKSTITNSPTHTASNTPLTIYINVLGVKYSCSIHLVLIINTNIKSSSLLL